MKHTPEALFTAKFTIKHTRLTIKHMAQSGYFVCFIVNPGDLRVRRYTEGYGDCGIRSWVR